MSSGLALLAVLVLFTAGSCSKGEKGPIRVGLVTTLTGAAGTSGICSRDGAILAVEQTNEAGGINGRPVELVIRDDKGSVEQALRVERELIDSGVKAVLGPFLSSLAVAMVPLMNEQDILMIGLGTITAKLSNMNDNFIRVAVPVDIRIPILAEVSYQELDLRKIAIVSDISNPDYTQSCSQTFKKTFEDLGGEITKHIEFNSNEEFSAVKISSKLVEGDNEGVLLVTKALHSAFIAQHLRMRNSEMKIIESGWGISDHELITNGGRAVEGMISVHQFNEESTEDSFLRFKADYMTRFGEIGGNTAQRGYEAASVLMNALSQTDDPHKLKETILAKREYDGIDGKMLINKHGDPLRPLYVLEIRDGRIRTLRKISLEQVVARFEKIH